MAWGNSKTLSLTLLQHIVIPGSSVLRTIDNFSFADQRRRRSVPSTSTSLLFGLVIDTTPCLYPFRISEKSCPEIQGAISLSRLYERGHASSRALAEGTFSQRIGQRFQVRDAEDNDRLEAGIR